MLICECCFHVTKIPTNTYSNKPFNHRSSNIRKLLEQSSFPYNPTTLYSFVSLTFTWLESPLAKTKHQRNISMSRPSGPASISALFGSKNKRGENLFPFLKSPMVQFTRIKWWEMKDYEFVSQHIKCFCNWSSLIYTFGSLL